MPPPDDKNLFNQFNSQDRVLLVDQLSNIIGGSDKIMRFPPSIGNSENNQKISSIPFVVFAPYKRPNNIFYNSNQNGKILENLPQPKFAIVLPLPSTGLKTDYTVTMILHLLRERLG